MNELTKNSKNNEVVALLKAAKVTIGKIATIIDIRPTKTAGKSTVFCIAEVDLGQGQVQDSSIDRMSAFELIGQEFSSNNLMRGKMTINDSVIATHKLDKGSKLELADPNSGEILSARLEAYESFKPFYDEQSPIGYKKDGVFTAKLKQGKSFYRDSKVVAREPIHQLIPSSPAASLNDVVEQ